MAIDTTTKKISLFDLGCPLRRTLPVGDGSFSTGDKQHFIFLYSGIAAAGAVPADVPNVLHVILPNRPEHVICENLPEHVVPINRPEHALIEG